MHTIKHHEYWQEVNVQARSIVAELEYSGYSAQDYADVNGAMVDHLHTLCAIAGERHEWCMYGVTCVDVLVYSPNSEAIDEMEEGYFCEKHPLSIWEINRRAAGYAMSADIREKVDAIYTEDADHE